MRTAADSDRLPDTHLRSVGWKGSGLLDYGSWEWFKFPDEFRQGSKKWNVKIVDRVKFISADVAEQFHISSGGACFHVLIFDAKEHFFVFHGEAKVDFDHP